MADSKIDWTDAVWNPTTGCSKLSQGCARCYAATMSTRLQAMGQPKYKDGFAVRFHADELDKPLHWRKPRRIFVNSMSDLFHDEVTDEQIDRVFSVMDRCPHHTFQVLTKRPERMRDWFGWRAGRPGGLTPHPHVWLGVSVESAEHVGRIALLSYSPCVVRFVSFEPLLSAIPDVNLGAISWAICGCESGPHARPMDLNWARSLRDQCTAARIPYFLKQAYIDGKFTKMPALDGKTWAEMPTTF